MPKIALITGGNRGLGRGEALALAADGTDVVITFRSHADEAKAVVATAASAASIRASSASRPNRVGRGISAVGIAPH